MTVKEISGVVKAKKQYVLGKLQKYRGTAIPVKPVPRALACGTATHLFM